MVLIKVVGVADRVTRMINSPNKFHKVRPVKHDHLYYFRVSLWNLHTVPSPEMVLVQSSVPESEGLQRHNLVSVKCSILGDIPLTLSKPLHHDALSLDCKGLVEIVS